MVYIWSDLHLGHSNIIKYGERPFQNIEEMDDALINNWKKIIKPKDIIINLGDFAFKQTRIYLNKLVNELPGYKILILGNHDRKKSMSFWMDVGFNEVYKYPIIYVEKYILSHEPVQMIENMPYINIHGHIHNKKIKNKNQINVSVEQTNYKPISFKKIIKIKNNKKGVRQSVMRGMIPFLPTVTESQETSAELFENEALVDALKRYKSISGKDDFDIAKTEPFFRAVESLGSGKSMRITLQEQAVKVRLNFKGEDFVLDYNFEEPNNTFVLSKRDGKVLVKDCNLSSIYETLERF
jgi:calcineurin-like phosphoesterase family protein